jgi:hypothetical protein
MQWYSQTSSEWTLFRVMPIRQLFVLISAIFVLFSSLGYYVDIVTAKGALPYVIVLIGAAYAGLNALLWIVVLARLPRLFLLPMIALQFFTRPIHTGITNWIAHRFHLRSVDSSAGIDFASTAIMLSIVLSYLLFGIFIRREGLRSFRMQHELQTGAGSRFPNSIAVECVPDSWSF